MDGALAVLGASLFIFGLITYQPYHVVVGRADSQLDHTVQDYRIAVSNKLYRPVELRVRVQGLPEGSYRLSTENIKLLPAGRDSLTLFHFAELAARLYAFVVDVSAPDGWTGHLIFNIFRDRVGAMAANDNRENTGLSGVKESRWGEETRDHFGYATDEERLAKRGMEDWELVKKYPNRKKAFPTGLGRLFWRFCWSQWD
ncbi:MAG: hypothetical protein WDM70_04430 [Nitrosomonadales bacterium]